MIDNVSEVTMFTLSGFNETTNHRRILFAVTSLCYSVIWLVNMAVISTIIVDKSLHEPMYIFLCNLCINGLYGTTAFYPKFLSDLLSHSHVISYAGCFLQGFVIHSSLGADFSILALMAYDRYVAICRPLVYHTVMTKQRVCLSVFISWLIPHYMLFMSTISTLQTRLCGSHIPKLYCINGLIGKLACSASLANMVIAYFNYLFYFVHIVFIVCSYMHLLRKCATSRENKRKFMQTCMPHLFCLITVVVSALFDVLYMRLGTTLLSESLQNFMSIVFLLIPPVINPVMYGFNLSKIRNRIRTFICSKRV
ncbi:olfactory receptor 4S1-like [Genypterus blacodes]|uniref:olfactory receptor 4S1-like n=1 Tax=Genypterus blacodes TaxID=154954 RepID=UPI003F766617